MAAASSPVYENVRASDLDVARKRIFRRIKAKECAAFHRDFRRMVCILYRFVQEFHTRQRHACRQVQAKFRARKGGFFGQCDIHRKGLLAACQRHRSGRWGNFGCPGLCGQQAASEQHGSRTAHRAPGMGSTRSHKFSSCFSTCRTAVPAAWPALFYVVLFMRCMRVRWRQILRVHHAVPFTSRRFACSRPSESALRWEYVCVHCMFFFLSVFGPRAARTAALFDWRPLSRLSLLFIALVS